MVSQQVRARDPVPVGVISFYEVKAATNTFAYREIGKWVVDTWFPRVLKESF